MSGWNPKTLSKLSGDQIGSFPAAAFEGVTEQQAKKFKGKFIKNLDSSQIRSLEPEALEAMPAKTIGRIEDLLSSQQMEALGLLTQGDGQDIGGPVI